MDTELCCLSGIKAVSSFEKELDQFAGVELEYCSDGRRMASNLIRPIRRQYQARTLPRTESGLR